MKKFSFILTVNVFLLFSNISKAQTLVACETSFQKNNLLLLAEQYNITSANAAVIQAKIWDLPFFSGEINAINPDDNKYFDAGKNGQKSLAIQQLIYLGGKKKNEVAFAKANVAIASLQFEQLVRTLKYQLAQNYYGIYFDQRKLNIINSLVSKFDSLLFQYNEQAKKGNIPLKEVVRLQTLVTGLQTDKNSIQRDLIKQQQDLLLITGMQQEITPVINEADLNRYQKPKIPKQELFTIAITTNPEYLTTLKIHESHSLYLQWQKSLAVSDVTAGLTYDQRGGAFQNQINISFGLPLPLWNRNKGNIKSAEAQLSQSVLTIDFKKTELQHAIDAAWQIWQQQNETVATITKTSRTNLETVYEGVVNNFQKRNITLLEFTDFIESYNLSSLQINEFMKQWVLASLQLNYITNAEVF